MTTAGDAALLARANGTEGVECELAALSAERLKDLAEREGHDFATALLYDRLARVPTHVEFRRAAEAAARERRPEADWVGIVPGAFHAQYRHTGGDGARMRRIAEDLGYRAEVLPLSSFGTLAENARAIRGWLAGRRGRGVLMSLSKGSADVKCALGQPGAAADFAGVKSWINFSGSVLGSPLVDWLLGRRLRWWSVRLLLRWHALRAQPLEELRYGPGTPLAGWPALPEPLRVVHVYGFPCRHHLAHPWAPRGYARMAPMGPNDGGGFLLADLRTFPGVACPIWGVDHYLTPGWDLDPLLGGILMAAASDGAVRQASQSASAPMAPPASRSSA